MTEPMDIVIANWIVLPLVFAALLFSIRACFRRLTLHRVMLASSCALCMIALCMAFIIAGIYPTDQISVVYLVAIVAYNHSLWLSRLYVCLRMAKLCPSPAMSAAFDRLAYVAGTLFVMTMTAYIMSAIHFYQTHSLDEVAGTDATGVAVTMIAELMYEIASIYLHARCLKMFAAFNSTGLKLVVISCSTLTCIGFGMLQISAMITGDTLLEFLMGGMLIAGLPTSITLGEVIIIYIGRRSGRLLKSADTSSEAGNSKTGNTKSTLGSKVKATASVSKEDPIRQAPVLAQPSV